MTQLADLKKEAAAAELDWPLPEKEVAPGQSFYERKIFACKGHKVCAVLNKMFLWWCVLRI